ncbi:hypothetical protein GYA19_01060 [Candidatus Beckwithbacteria bacterium]|nr:hypothetical protein [Candidatus Beckwithbacteria bacterium]
MSELNDILGMNGRNLNYLCLNKKTGRKIADSKLRTKKVLKKTQVANPRLLKVFRSISDINNFDWLRLKTGFVLKPSEGYGGEGILVVKKPGYYAGEWIRMDGTAIKIEDLKIHAKDIIEGRFSRNRTPDMPFIEERIKIHPKFLKYAYKGTPDVRVIVFNKIPVMAMLRLPTKESDGKANLHQGALGLGVDMATGITTYGVHHNYLIKYIPGTNRKVNGLLIPFWERILKTAVDAQIASTLGFAGIDIVVDEEKGPMVLEINDQPGLQIQMANREGLLRRLQRLEKLNIGNSDYKGIQIAQLLFAESFADKIKAKEGKKILGIFEQITLKDGIGEKHELVAKIDTGAFSVSIDKTLAKDLGLLNKENILYKTEVESSLGKQTRSVIELEFWLQGQKIKAMATVSNRKGLTSPILIGRRYLQGFFIDPSKVKNF